MMFYFRAWIEALCGVRPPAGNYNHLSVPDPATACGNLLYRAMMLMMVMMMVMMMMMMMMVMMVVVMMMMVIIITISQCPILLLPVGNYYTGREGGIGEENGSKRWFQFLVSFFCAFDVECCVVCYGEVYQVFTIRTF